MSTNQGEVRPAPSPELSGAELARWYWTLAELSALARRMGLSTGGGKAAVTARIAAALDGLPAPAPVPAAGRPARGAGRQLAAPVDGASVIPPGQRCSQVLREYFVREIGPGFHFDAFMRDYVAQGAGRTLAEAVAHWHATRERAAQPQEIGAQFELNRFLRDWHARHPEGTRPQALAAWRAHRSSPRKAAVTPGPQ
ncbi:SAP domain-containing protein [Streptomyces sp. NBC_00335]|uniref:DUF6434 domain-containing protein n=1 Tax=unclassified Streptomyces TaxID=2593676 RepID=UPI00224D2EC2|nr:MULTISPECIES: DUF6434 domain-containing protein [unclassified Streptomyces]MCX5403294.1 SAP domain-containing protein [Streptomyces sp. NBC_00086]